MGNPHVVNEYLNRCRERGLPVTPQKRVILEELASRKDHPTADQLYDAVRERLPGLSRTTVYRVLEALVRVGAARKVAHPRAVARFDLMGERHHHLLCERCGRLVDVEASAVPDIPIPDELSGFEVRDYSIDFTGICDGCRVGTPSTTIPANHRV